MMNLRVHSLRSLWSRLTKPIAIMALSTELFQRLLKYFKLLFILKGKANLGTTGLEN